MGSMSQQRKGRQRREEVGAWRPEQCSQPAAIMPSCSNRCWERSGHSLNCDTEPDTTKEPRRRRSYPCQHFLQYGIHDERIGNGVPAAQVRFDMKGIKTRLNAPKRHYKHARYQNGAFKATTTVVLKKGKVNISHITRDNPVAISFGDSLA